MGENKENWFWIVQIFDKESNEILYRESSEFFPQPIETIESLERAVNKKELGYNLDELLRNRHFKNIEKWSHQEHDLSFSENETYSYEINLVEQEKNYSDISTVVLILVKCNE